MVLWVIVCGGSCFGVYEFWGDVFMILYWCICLWLLFECYGYYREGSGCILEFGGIV